MSVLTVDIGTTRCKVALYDRMLRRERLVDTSTPGIRSDGTFDLRAIVETVMSLIGELVEGGAVDGGRRCMIEAAAVTSFLSHVFVTSRGAVESCGLSWSWQPEPDASALLFDACSRADYQLERPLGPELLAPRLVSLARERTQWAGSLVRVLAVKDVVREVLVGRILIGGNDLVLNGPPEDLRTDWSVRDYSLIRDRRDRPIEPVISILKQLGYSAPAALIPPASSPGDPGDRGGFAGSLPGLGATVPLVLGSTDGTAAMYGGGVLHPGTVVAVFGTTDVVMRVRSGPAGVPVPTPVPTSPPPQPRTVGLSSNAVVPVGGVSSDTVGALSFPFGGFTLVGGSTAPSGSLQTWLQELLRDGGDGWEAVIPGAEGLVFVPGIAGERAPWNIPGTRGAVIGIEYRHSAAHVMRALLEAATYRVRMILEQLIDDGAPGIPASVQLRIGGGNRSAAINQLRAAILPVPVLQRNENELSLCGAAIFAWCGLAPAGPQRWERFRALSAVAAHDVVPVEPGDQLYDDRLYRRWKKMAQNVYREYV